MAAFILAFYSFIHLFMLNEITFFLAFSFHEVVLVACKMLDSVKAKSHGGKKPLFAGYLKTHFSRREEKKNDVNLDFSYFVFQCPKVHLTIQKRVK